MQKCMNNLQMQLKKEACDCLELIIDTSGNKGLFLRKPEA